MPRPDLTALTDEGLIQLSNAGLVKRALRELEAGTVPELEEQADGAIIARFSDGTLTRISSGQGLTEADCSCPSSGVCRHRVMLAVAYRAQKITPADGEAPRQTVPWNPASLDPVEIEANLPASAKAELARLFASRHVVRLEYGVTPTAHMPMASVRFLVPHDLSYARCDCVQGSGCAHVAMAVRAFQEAQGAPETVLGNAADTVPGVDIAALRTACDTVIERLLEAGVTAGPSAHAQTLETARRHAERAGAAQLLLVIAALTEQIGDYANRSARYDEGAILRLAAGLFARTRAADATSALGLGQPFETAMGKSRLISLGARLRQEGPDIRASILLADSDMGATMLIDRLFSPRPQDDAQHFSASLSSRQLLPGLPVGGVGRGQILTSVASRRADGVLGLGRGSSGRTRLMPRDALFSFPAPLAVTTVEQVAERLDRRPVSLLRPYKRHDTVHVFDVDDVIGQSWAPGRQFWEGAVQLAGGGGTVYLEREFDAAAPGAPGILMAAFEGQWGRVRQVAGTVRSERGVLVCDPWSISADRFIVPDLEAGGGGKNLAMTTANAAPDLLDETAALLAGMLHAGQRSRAAIDALRPRIAARLLAAGYHTMAGLIDDRSDISSGAVEPFCKAAMWLLTIQESRDSPSQSRLPTPVNTSISPP